MLTMKSLAAAGILALSISGTALAGEQFVDETGFAVSGFDVVAYFDKTQQPVGTSQTAATPGQRTITAEYNGSVFAFANQENRDRFIKEPGRYAPQFDGHCAFGVAVGGKVPGNPHLWRILDGKLYLNVKDTVVTMWEADIPGNLQRAGGNWPGLEPEPASTDPVPDLDTTQSPVGG